MGSPPADRVRRSQFDGLHHVDDSRLLAVGHLVIGTSPDALGGAEKPFGLFPGVELEVDHHVVGVVHCA